MPIASIYLPEKPTQSCRVDLGSLDRAQVAIEPGQSLFDEFISRWGVVGFIQFQLFVGGGRSQEVVHRLNGFLRTTSIEFSVQHQGRYFHPGYVVDWTHFGTWGKEHA